MNFNLNHSLKQTKPINDECEIVETKIHISSELINYCNFQSSMNENEMNFQYLKHLEVEFMNSNFKLKEVVLNVEEIKTEKSTSYVEKAIEVNTSSEGFILKELPEHLKYAFFQQETAKPVFISARLIELEEQKLLEILRKYKKEIAWSIDDLK